MDNENKEKKVKTTTKKTNSKTTGKKTNNTKTSTKKQTKTTEKKADTKTQKKATTNSKKSTKESPKKEKISEGKKSTSKKVISEKKANVKEKVKKAENDVTELEKNDAVIELKKDDVEKNNKTILVALLAILLIIIGVCVYYQLEDKEKNNASISETESNKIMDEFYDYFNSKDEKIIYYASSTCGYCELQTPIMEQIDKDYDIDYLYIDSTKLTTEDRETVLKELSIEHATPTTVVVKNGKVIGTNIGYVDGKEMVSFLKENNILDEDAIYTPEAYITFIDYSEYEELIESEEMSIITIGQTGCSHCIATKPVLNTIAKDYDITINYLNLTDMSQDEQSNFFDSLTEIGYDEESFVSSGSFGTPLTLIVEDGKVVSYINGENPTSYYIRVFKKVGIISE